MAERKYCIVYKAKDSTRDCYRTERNTWVNAGMRGSEAQTFDSVEQAAAALKDYIANKLSPHDDPAQFVVGGHGWCNHPDQGAGRL